MAIVDWTDAELKDIINQIYKDFARIADDKLGLDIETVMRAGVIGCKIHEAEFRLFGPISYATSLMLPLRNALYRRDNMFPLWHHRLSKMNLKPPILDYGCGMGFTLAFLSQVLDGEPELYGYELVGVQYGFMDALGQIYGFKPWNDEPVNTILATNLLEHLANPLETLNYFYTLTDNVIANVDMEPQEDHIAPLEEREACIALLKERGGFIEAGDRGV